MPLKSDSLRISFISFGSAAAMLNNVNQAIVIMSSVFFRARITIIIFYSEILVVYIKIDGVIL